MENARFDKFITERQKLLDFLNTFEIQLENLLEDFEKISLDKLDSLNDLIADNEDDAKIMGGDFFEKFEKFQIHFNHFVETFENIKRFKIEITLNDFSLSVQMLKSLLFI